MTDISTSFSRFSSSRIQILGQLNTTEVVKETSGLDTAATLGSTAETGGRTEHSLLTGLKWLEVGATQPESVM